MAYALYSQSYGAVNANAAVAITEAVTGLPAVILSSATGGFVTDTGKTKLDSSGNLAVYIDTAKTWEVKLDDGSVAANQVVSQVKYISAGDVAGFVGQPGVTYIVSTSPFDRYVWNGTSLVVQPTVSNSGNVIGSGGAPVSVGGNFVSSAPAYLLAPRSIPLALWLDASKPMHKVGYSGQCVIGDAVGIWPDASGNFAHATVAGGAPVMALGSNGLPGVDMRGTGAMTTPVGVMKSAMSQAFHVFIAASANASMATLGARYLLRVAGINVWLGIMGTTGGPDITVATVNGFPSFQGVVPRLSDVYSFGINTAIATARIGPVGHRGRGGSIADMVTTGLTAGTAFADNAVFVGGLSGSSQLADFVMHEVRIVSRGLTLDEQRQIHEDMAIKWALVPNTVFLVGNSLTSGSLSTSGATQATSAAGNNLPGYLQSLLGTSWHVATDAYPGRSDLQIAAEAPNFTGKLLARSAIAKQVVVPWETTNALATYRSVGLCQDATTQFARSMRLAGAKVVAPTILNRIDGNVYAGFDADRQTYNNWLRANWSTFADGLCDFAADSRLADPNNATYFDVDKTHLNSVGYSVLASVLRPVVLSI